MLNQRRESVVVLSQGYLCFEEQIIDLTPSSSVACLQRADSCKGKEIALQALT